MASIEAGSQVPAAMAREETIKAVTDAMDQLHAAVRDFGAIDTTASGNDLDRTQRWQIMEAAKRVLDAVKSEEDIWVDKDLDFALCTACRLFYKWGAFEAIPTEGSISYQELAVATEAEEALLRRIGGVLVSQGFLKQTGPDHLVHTCKSLFYRNDHPYSSVFDVNWSTGVVPYGRMPEYFEKYGRKEPQTTNHVPATFAHGRPELSFYEMLGEDEAWLGSFTKAMAHIQSRMPMTAGRYDFGWLVAEAQAHPGSDRAVLVDVGGGEGGAIKVIRSEFPGLPAHRCVLEDRPETLEAGRARDEPELAGVQRVPVDFHKNQPVKGAYTYYMRRCLHNYSDEVCRNMLRILADAMAPDSRLLIQDEVLDNPPEQRAAFLDFMMLVLGGKQRSLDNWQRLFDSVGLRISSISRGEGPWGTIPVIEAVLKG